MNLLQSIFLLCMLGLVHGQGISDYKYIELPANFSKLGNNQYELQEILKVELEQKNYIVLDHGLDNWPEEAKLNPCLVLHADVRKVKATTAMLELNFHDCNQRSVLEQKGASQLKPGEKGYQDALHTALSHVTPQKVIINSNLNDGKDITIITTKPIATDGTLPLGKRSITIKHSESEFQKYTHGAETVYITSLEANQFLMTSKDKSRVIAHFYPSSLKNIYHVKIYREYMNFYYTIGYYDGIKLWYEYTKDNENWFRTEFNKAE